MAILNRGRGPVYLAGRCCGSEIQLAWIGAGSAPTPRLVTSNPNPSNLCAFAALRRRPHQPFPVRPQQASYHVKKKSLQTPQRRSIFWDELLFLDCPVQTGIRAIDGLASGPVNPDEERRPFSSPIIPHPWRSSSLAQPCLATRAASAFPLRRSAVYPGQTRVSFRRLGLVRPSMLGLASVTASTLQTS